MSALLITNQNSLGNHLIDILKKDSLKTMRMDSNDGDYVFYDYQQMKMIPETFTDVIFILDYQNRGFDFNQQDTWNNFVIDELFYHIFTRLFEIITQIKFNNFILISPQYASDSEGVYSFWYKKAEEIVCWFCELYNKGYTIFRVYDLMGSKAKHRPDINSLTYHFMSAASSGFFYQSKISEIYRPIHVIDACNAIKKAIGNPSNNIEHLCSKTVYKIDQLINLFQKVNVLHLDKIPIDRPVSKKEYLWGITPSSFLTEKFTPEDWVRLRKKDFDTLNIIK